MLVFQRQPLHPRRYPDVFRVRMTGREIILLPLHYCRSGIALAPYAVALNGTYHFEVTRPLPDVSKPSLILVCTEHYCLWVTQGSSADSRKNTICPYVAQKVPGKPSKYCRPASVLC